MTFLAPLATVLCVTVVALSALVHPSAALGTQHSAARLLIDDARAFTNGDSEDVSAPPPPLQALRRTIGTPAVAPSAQQAEDDGPLANYGLSYVGGAVSQRRASSPVVPATAPGMTCQKGVPCPQPPSLSVASYNAPHQSRGAPSRAPSMQPSRAPAPAPPAGSDLGTGSELKSPSKGVPPGAFQKAIPAPKVEVAFKSN